MKNLFLKQYFYKKDPKKCNKLSVVGTNAKNKS